MRLPEYLSLFARLDALITCEDASRAWLPLIHPRQRSIVVDNASQSDETRIVVGEFQGVEYCSEPIMGLGRARNAGLLRATCEIVA